MPINLFLAHCRLQVEQVNDDATGDDSSQIPFPS